jgi:mannose-6-phosphate isomerase-like protein (cupin superfamily)
MPRYLLKKHAYNPSDSPVAMARRRPQWPFGIHAHEFSELVIICGGRGKHITETEVYPLKRGDVFIITAKHTMDTRI